MESIDVLIVNQGISGLALACGLSNYFSVGIIDYNLLYSKNFVTNQWDIKASLVNMASVQILQYLKIWNRNIINFSSMLSKWEIFKNNNTTKIILNSGYLGYPDLGYVIDTRLIYQALMCRAKQLKNIVFIDSNFPNTINFYEHAVFVTLKNNYTFSAKLVIGADGISSWVRKNAHLSVIFKDSMCYTLTNIIHTEKNHKNVLRCIVHNDGLLVSLPLQDKHLSIVLWILPSHIAKKYLYTRDTDRLMNDNLIKICNLLLGNCIIYNNEKNKISMFRAQYTHNFVNHRLVLLGQAAYTTCPLFFQNINLELIDMIVLLNYLKQLKKNNRDIGNYSYLKYYKYNRILKIVKNCMNIPYFYMLLNDCNNIAKYAQYLIFYLINTVPHLKVRVLHHIMGIDDIPEWLL